MRKRIGSFLRLAAVSSLCIAGSAGPATADIEVLDANLSPSADGHGQRPVVKIKYYPNIANWDATGEAAVFRLQLYLKVNVGSYLVNFVVHLPDLSNDENARISGVFAGWKEPHPRIVRYNSIVRDFPSYDLGAFTTQAITLCRSQLPDGKGTRRFDLDMNVTLSVTAIPGVASTKFRTFQFPRKIPVSVSCVGLPTEQEKREPERKVEFKLINTTLKVTRFNRDCPRRVAVRVTMRANMDRRVEYVLRRSDGPNQRQDMVIQWQGGERYKGSFDHQFEVATSRNLQLWVEHKGRRVSDIRRIGIDCSQPWEPEGLWVE